VWEVYEPRTAAHTGNECSAIGSAVSHLGSTSACGEPEAVQVSVSARKVHALPETLKSATRSQAIDLWFDIEHDERSCALFVSLAPEC
jgi:hypothetical protein